MQVAAPIFGCVRNDPATAATAAWYLLNTNDRADEERRRDRTLAAMQSVAGPLQGS
jgi:hypothetical protein